MSIKINCDTDAKQKNRELFQEFIARQFTRQKMKEAKVLFLPGPQALDVQIYDELGFKRSNLYALTNEEEDFRLLRRVKGLNVYLCDIFKPESWLWPLFERLRSPAHRKAVDLKRDIMKMDGLGIFDIIHFDLYSNIQKQTLSMGIFTPWLKSGGIFGVTWYGRRDKNNTYMRTVRIVNALCDETSIQTRIDTFLWMFLEAALLAPYQMKTGKWGKGAFLLENIIKMPPSIAEQAKMQNQCPVEKKKEFKEIVMGGGRYPIDVLKTAYWGGSDGKQAMLSFFVKMRSASGLGPFQFEEKVLGRIFQAMESEVVEINPEDVKTRKDTLELKKEDIIYLLKENTPKEISEAFDLPLPRVRAIKAHVTMGTYS